MDTIQELFEQMLNEYDSSRLTYTDQTFLQECGLFALFVILHKKIISEEEFLEMRKKWVDVRGNDLMEKYREIVKTS